MELVAALSPVVDNYDIVILECVTLWLSNIMVYTQSGNTVESDIPSKVGELLKLYESGGASWIVVSNEVGLGVISPTKLGRQYADELGRVNQQIAAEADFVYFMAVGLPMQIKGERPADADPTCLKGPVIGSACATET